jgi:hypothetical protein
MTIKPMGELKKLWEVLQGSWGTYTDLGIRIRPLGGHVVRALGS